MKPLRQLMGLLLAGALLTAGYGLAETQEEFELGCRKKTAFAVSVFEFTQDEEIIYIQCGGTPSDQQAADSIPAGTYVHLETEGANGWKYITYMHSGALRSGWAQVTLMNCTSLILMEDDLVHEIHENDPDYARALAVGTPERETFPSLGPDPIQEADPADSSPALQGGRAYIYAPKTGKATLRSGPSEDHSAIQNCPAGMIVQILDADQQGFTHIDCGGVRGFIKTGCLRRLSGAPQTLGVGLLVCEGEAEGASAVNIRISADKASARIAQWPTGARVTVFSREGNWYEIEANGLHGFVQAEYVSIEP